MTAQKLISMAGRRIKDSQTSEVKSCGGVNTTLGEIKVKAGRSPPPRGVGGAGGGRPGPAGGSAGPPAPPARARAAALRGWSQRFCKVTSQSSACTATKWGAE